jgi:hypothetical protein
LKSEEGTLFSFSSPLSNVFVSQHSGYLYTSFASQADYEFVLAYAKQLDVVLWENGAKRCFFGTLEGHGRVRGFIERRTGAGD